MNSPYGTEVPNLPQPPKKPTHQPEVPGGGSTPKKRKRGGGGRRKKGSASGFKFGRRRRSFLAKWLKATFGAWAKGMNTKRTKSFRNHGFSGSGRGYQTGFKGMARKR